MLRLFGTAIAVSGLTLAFSAAAQIEPGSDAEGPSQAEGLFEELQRRVSDTYIFVFDDSMPANRVDSAADRLLQGVEGALGHVYRHAIRGFSARMSAESAERIARNGAIAYYVPDGIATIASEGPRIAADGPSAQAQTVDWGVQRVNGPMDGTNLGLYAFVIDTGVDLDHPDLNVDLSLSVSCVSGNSSPNDENGHGTHVAGIIAAKDNGSGTVGVAAGATVVSARVLNAQGSGSYSDIIACVDYVAQVGLPGEVANLSLGGPPNAAVDDAVRGLGQRGIFVSIAAGNSAQPASNFSPARANGTNVYTISASDQNDELASFSNFGNPPIECAAPGVQILSLWNDGGTMFLSGTSMAAPHAAGIFLLTGGRAYNGGLVSWDRDSTPDPICVKL